MPSEPKRNRMPKLDQAGIGGIPRFDLLKCDRGFQIKPALKTTVR